MKSENVGASPPHPQSGGAPAAPMFLWSFLEKRRENAIWGCRGLAPDVFRFHNSDFRFFCL